MPARLTKKKRYPHKRAVIRVATLFVVVFVDLDFRFFALVFVVVVVAFVLFSEPFCSARRHLILKLASPLSVEKGLSPLN